MILILLSLELHESTTQQDSFPQLPLTSRRAIEVCGQEGDVNRRTGLS